MKKFKWAIAFTIVGILSIGVMVKVYPTFLHPTGRIGIWKEVIQDTISSNLSYTGTGFGSFAAHGFKSGNKIAKHAHSEFVQMFKEGGVFLLIIFSGYMISLIVRSVRYIRNNSSILFICYSCAFISYFIISLTGFPLRIAPLALVGILYIASLETQLQGEHYV